MGELEVRACKPKKIPVMLPALSTLTMPSLHSSILFPHLCKVPYSLPGSAPALASALLFSPVLSDHTF